MTGQRYCLGPEALRHLQREGLDWGHDLDCGCGHGPTARGRTAPGLWRRIAQQLRGEG